MARSKGQGSIYQRSNGLYVGTLVKHGVKKSFSSMDKNVVETKLLAYSKSPESSKVKTRFSTYVNDYIYTFKYKHIKDSSFDRLESIYRNHIENESIGKIPLCDLNDIIIQRYINEKVSSGLSLSSVKKIFELIRTVLYYAYRRGDIDVDYGSLIKLPNNSNFKEIKHIEVYTDDECQVLREYILGNYYHSRKEARFLRYAPVYLIMLNTGLRTGELLALTWSDIDFKNRVIHIRHSLSFIKNRQEESSLKNVSVISSVKTSASKRDIPMNDFVINCFRELDSRYVDFDCRCDYVVSNLNDEFVKLRSFETKFKKICEKAGVTYKGVHALRHTFASNLINKGVSPKVVSCLLGHTNVVFTLNRYVHENEEQLSHAVSKLDS
ncbi:MAG: site-specific integrase [Lachnospiraceae bacterium]|nr:site-specific integrase [Lachnospiraceae bacterium]